MGWRCLGLCFLALTVSVVDVQARLVRNHVSSICSTWGREHFKTFDGDVYQFPGMCEYNLASDCHETYQEFSVHMKRIEEDGNPTISYLVVTINDLSIHLGKTLVTVNGLPINLPYHNAGVRVEKDPIYMKLQSKVGIVVMWNGEDAVTVELDRDYANRTCGLCGDFNGVYNEFIHNGRKISPTEFGNKQKAHRPNDDCEDPYEEEDQPLEDVTLPDSCKEFQTSCEQILHSESWSSCTELINPEAYIQACARDMCGCISNTSDFCVCSTVSEFSRQCSHAGGQPPNWRTPQFCAVQCPYNMAYEESGSPCMETCTDQDTNLLCEDHRMDGCFCPPGTVFDDLSMRGCIDKSQCQCKHDKIYNSTEVYRQETEECICLEGRWVCKSLKAPATCALEEGSHVTTFDGKTYTFHGDCYYTLAKVESKDASSPKFTILAQLAPCRDQEFDTCLKTLKIVLNNDRNNVLMFTSDGTVKQNMQTVTLPYQSGDINIFHASSFHIMLQTSFGLQIQIQHVPLMQVYVRMDQSYKAKTRGLCGNYNMVLSDDMKTPQGIVEGTAATFCNSWKANGLCQDREERLNDPCALSVENERYAKHWCALLLSPSSTFAQCHSAVDPEMYHKRCMYASCTCEKSDACLCAIFSSYARACASKRVILTGWRDNVCDKHAKTCPKSQIFSYEHQRCQMTCKSLGSNQQSCSSDFLPVDGCSCPEGFYLNEKDICVPMAKCPCYHNEVYIKPGKSINIKDEHCVCINGKLHCRSWKTHSLISTPCRSPKVYFNCSTAGIGELGLQCAPTCSNLDSDDCDSTECESGCLCPSGFLDDGKGSCVKQHDCPCKHNNQLYANGAKITNQCNTCTCKSGKWECTKNKCPGTCTIYGSGHHTTFDQRTYGFPGKCAYIAVKNKCGNKTVEGNFGVITENVPCGTTGTTCSKIVRIQLGRREIKLSKGKYEEEDLGQGTQIEYKIRRVGLYLVIESAIGLAVMWDRKTAVRILLEPQHSGEVCGLCGDFDGDGLNDFTTKGQLTVSSPIEFANSWKVSSSCPDVEMNGDPCIVNPQRHPWAKMMCSIITGETFKECHSKVDANPFYENCVKDSCACDTGGDCECFCTAVAAYAQACSEAGVCVAWRTPDICPVFCDYYNSPDDCKWHYHACHTPCYKTCLNPQENCSNPLPNLEGCFPKCPEDKPIFDEETQMCVEECVTTTTPEPQTTTTQSTPSTPETTTTPKVGTATTRSTTPPTVTTTTVPTTTTQSTPSTPETTTTPRVGPTTTRSTTPPTVTTTTARTTTPEMTTPTTEHTTVTGTPSTTATSTITSTVPPTTTEASTTATISSATTPCIITCEWSEWYNEDDPLKDHSDWETYENITNSGKEICKNPQEIDCRSASQPDIAFDDYISQTGQVATCNIDYGLICRKEDQILRPFKCFDYKIRVCCEIEICTTTEPTTTTESTPSTVTTTTTTRSTTPATVPTTTAPTTTTQSTPSTPETTTTPKVGPTTMRSTTPATVPTTTAPTTTTQSTPSTPETTTTHEVITGPTSTTVPTGPNVNGTTPTPTTPTTLIPPPICPEWNVTQNETFFICNCTLARCIENNTIEIITYECPPLVNITCANGKDPVLLYDELSCCRYYACDCVCEGWGDPHYITFDGLYYSYQGNCSYVLMEEILPKHDLKIYIDNVFCDPTEDVSCPRSIIISYSSQVIKLINHNLIGAADLEAFKDEHRLKLPYSQQGVKVLTTGLNLILEIPEFRVVITFGITGFSVTLPYQYFGKNTQGHCGTCNNNQADDCMLPGGQLVKDCAVMADYWPAKHIEQPDCPIPSIPPTDKPGPTPTLTPCKPDSMCDLLTSSVFAECHAFVSPDRFYQGCVFDSCHVSNQVVECTSLQTYAAACAQAGVCLHWRNHTTLCASNCPSNKIYKPCGPVEQPTCEDNPNEVSMNYTTEGCFCPDGMKLFNKESGICVEKCGCLDPEGVPREFNERFEYKCQDCICEESTKTVKCKPKVCPAPPIVDCTDPGFVLVNKTNPSDPCCSTFDCQCHINTCPLTDMNCPVGYTPTVSVPAGKCCPEHTCVPKRVCVHKDVEYQPGSSVPAATCQDCICTNEVDPKSSLFKITCEFKQCQEKCDTGYDYVETDSDECCGKCVQTHCVLNINGTTKLLTQGETWTSPEDKCQHYSCDKSGETLTTTSSYILCPPFQQSNCQPDTIQTAANGCCKICMEKERACKLVPMKTRITIGTCQSKEEVDRPYCEGSCNTFTKYSEAAAAMQQSCSCCQQMRFSNHTVDLKCLNGDVIPYTYMHVEECSCHHADCTKTAAQHARRRRSFTLL
ncbi:mucin-2 [Larimichthys crocea]|uniref:mucin-2 n=1 Tax=Larimichthys crocea TaxID=215358 RepID=UPI000F5FB6FD|nr:otogelin [Larimichthys crocea]